MATFKLIFTSVFLLALVYSHELIRADGRQLRPQMNKKCENYGTVCDKNATENGRNSGNNLNWRRGIFKHEAVSETADPTGFQSPADANVEPSHQPIPANGTDDFRPTVPGHSPGAGHAKPPRIIDPIFP